ncbi:MAG TPA: TetR/AcrR family transcriptional regulator [Actinopolymorphaceae bacterium]
MAVAFDAEERARITRSLLQTAERLFAGQGLKKTSLDDLTAPAGIAKTSFYAFFESKEALYLEVMLRRAPLVAEALAAPLRRQPSADSLSDLMQAMANVLSTDPLYRRLLTHPEELRAVRRRVRPDEVERIHPVLIAPLLEFVRRGQAEGVVVGDVPPEVVLDVLGTVGLIVLHRDEYGDSYAQVLAATIRALGRGLVEGVTE